MRLCKEAESGFTFQCQGCGRCCSNDIDGFVYVYMDDIKRMAQTLNLSLEEFAREHLKIVSYNYNIYNEQLVKTGKTKRMHTLVLKSTAGESSCRFLYKQNSHYLCQVYDARPEQCACFPFWDTIMTQSKNFIEIEMFCPGFNIGNKLQDQVLNDVNSNPTNITTESGNGENIQSHWHIQVNNDSEESQILIQRFHPQKVRIIDKEEIIRRTMNERKIEREYYITMVKAGFDIFKVYPFIQGVLSLPEEDII
jgi:Fe-S-cluster containining protein